MSFLANISMRAKLAVMVLTLTLPIIYLGFVFVSESTVGVNLKNNEIIGVKHHAFVTATIDNIAKHRGKTAAYLSGDESLLEEINILSGDVDQALNKLVEMNTQYDGKIDIAEELSEVNKQWNYIKKNKSEMRKRESFDKHSDLIEELNLMLDAIAYKSSLSFDSDIDMVYMAELSFSTLPILNNSLGQLRGATTALAVRQYLEDGEGAYISLIINDVSSALVGVKKSVDGIARNNDQLANYFTEHYMQLSQGVDAYISKVDKLLNDVTYLMNADADEAFQLGTTVIESSMQFYAFGLPKMEELLLLRQSDLKSAMFFKIGVASLLFVVAIIFSFLIVREMGVNFNKIKSLFKNIESGNYDNDVEVNGKTEFAQIFSSLISMQNSLIDAREKDQKVARINGRIKEALANASSSVVVADTKDCIIYCNTAAIDMFAEAQDSISQHIPGFHTDKLLDMKIDAFYQGDINMHELTSPYQAQLEMGKKKFNVIFNPVMNDERERIGTVMEWEDKTAELAIQDDVHSLVQAALDGDLSQRINLDDKDGFLRFLSEGINNLVDVSEHVVDDVIRVLSAISKGDLTEKIEQEYHGAFNQLKDDANATIDTLTEVVSKIKDSSGLVNEAANEISQGNLNLSDRTELQASRLEETSSNMTEMTSSVQQNAHNSKQANDLAISAKEQAEKGGIVVSDAVSAMTKINQASNKIADIIGVIDEIAFQTNLLALNAAVEAARAGEQGRGFAVVASEVRNLAGRSATAAKEIKELIEDSVVKVDEGTRLVNQSGETLDMIMNSVKEVAEIIGDISEASQEQADGISQVNQTIIQMDEATQQNAALVEQASASAESMSEQSSELNNLVEFFKVSKQQAKSRLSNPKQPMMVDNQVEERRSANRPWSNNEVVADQVMDKDVYEQNIDDDAGWEEF